MTLRDLLEQHGVDIRGLLAAPLATSLAERREQRARNGAPQAYTDAYMTAGVLEIRITVPLFDGKAAAPVASDGWTVAVTPILDQRTGEPNGVTAYELRSPDGKTAGEGHTYPSGGAVIEHPPPDPWEPENRQESIDAVELRARARFYMHLADDLDERNAQ